MSFKWDKNGVIDALTRWITGNYERRFGSRLHIDRTYAPFALTIYPVQLIRYWGLKGGSEMRHMFVMQVVLKKFKIPSFALRDVIMPESL